MLNSSGCSHLTFDVRHYIVVAGASLQEVNNTYILHFPNSFVPTLNVNRKHHVLNILFKRILQKDIHSEGISGTTWDFDIS